VKKLLAILVLTVFSVPFAAAAEKKLINVDKDLVAVKGYDVVAYFTDSKPVKGVPQIQTIYKGARYYFANKEHKALFDAAPEKYIPQFGGFCAYGVSKGHAVKIEPDAWTIVDGRLLLQYDQDVRTKFSADVQGNLKKADENWPGIVDKEGK
jgi:YHS domain-containing protein